MQALLLRSPVARPQHSVSGPRQHFTNVHGARGARLTRSALIGDVNDPEKSKQQKRKKEGDSIWAEPKNSNPLEGRQPATSGDGDGSNPIEKAKEAVDNAVDKAKDAVDNATQK